MLRRIALAVIVAIVVGLACLFLGSILASINVPIAETVGGFLRSWGWVIGVLAGAWYYFTGGSIGGPIA